MSGVIHAPVYKLAVDVKFSIKSFESFQEFLINLSNLSMSAPSHTFPPLPTEELIACIGEIGYNLPLSVLQNPTGFLSIKFQINNC